MNNQEFDLDALGGFDDLADEFDYDYSVNEMQITNMDEFRRLLLDPFLDGDRRIFYRGEKISSLKRPLLPTMFRDRGALIPEGKLYVDVDIQFILDHYMSSGHFYKLFCSTFGKARRYCMYDLCTFSQHYQQWSPLIDLTKSLYVALSFGLKGKREFENDALLYTVECSDEDSYTTDRVTAECWLDDYHVCVYDYESESEELLDIPRTSPEAKLIDIATNDRMKFQQGVFLLLNHFNLVNHFYLTKNVRGSVNISKIILDREICPELTNLVEREAPWYSFSNLLDIGAGIQTAIDYRRTSL